MENPVRNNVDSDQTPHYVASDLGLHPITGFQAINGIINHVLFLQVPKPWVFNISRGIWRMLMQRKKNKKSMLLHNFNEMFR